MTEKQSNRQSEILDVALRLFVRDGYAGTGIRAIAAEVGISEATIYHHFKSKEDILQALIELVVQGHPYFYDGLREDASVEDVLMLVGERFLDIMACQFPRDLTHLMIFESPHHPAMAARYLKEIHHGAIDHLEAALIPRMPESSPVTAHTVARVFWATMVSHVLHDEMLVSVVEGHEEPAVYPERDQRLRNTIQLILHGIGV